MNSQQRQAGPRTNGLVLLFLLLAVPLAFFLNIWADEASTLYTTQNGFLSAFQNAASNEKQAPLYFWVMSLWRTFNGSIFFARLFSVLCCAVAIKLFAGIASRVLSLRAALIATAFFAFHPILIWAAVEIRVYALVILLSVLLIKLFLDAAWDTDEKAPWLSRILFLVAAIFALYTNYYLLFLLVGLGVALIVTGRWRAAATYGVALLIVGLAFVPMLFSLNAQFAVNTGGFQEGRSLFDGLQTIWRHFLTFTLPAGIFPESEGTPFAVARVWIVRVAVVVVLIFAIKNRSSITRRSIGGIALVATVAAGLLGAYFLVGPQYVEIRHATILFVPLTIAIAVLLSEIFSNVSAKAAVLAPAVIVLIFFSYSLATLYPNMTKRGDWARIGAFIEQNERPGQPILVFTTFDALALPYHYRGQNKILPDEGFFRFEQEAPFGTENSLRSQTDFLISEIPPDAQEIWLAVNEKCIATDACRPLQNFIEANYTIEIGQQFYLEKVFLLRKKSK